MSPPHADVRSRTRRASSDAAHGRAKTKSALPRVAPYSSGANPSSSARDRDAVRACSAWENLSCAKSRLVHSLVEERDHARVGLLERVRPREPQGVAAVLAVAAPGTVA